eukprot:1156329-Pelagomonas_calceolata.AAC.7
MALSESDPPLFYALLQSKLEQLLPLLYTPTGAMHETKETDSNEHEKRRRHQGVLRRTMQMQHASLAAFGYG